MTTEPKYFQGQYEAEAVLFSPLESRVTLWMLVIAKFKLEITTEACTYCKSDKPQNTALKQRKSMSLKRLPDKGRT